jgi:hypothetical protein
LKFDSGTQIDFEKMNGWPLQHRHSIAKDAVLALNIGPGSCHLGVVVSGTTQRMYRLYHEFGDLRFYCFLPAAKRGSGVHLNQIGAPYDVCLMNLFG